MNIFGNSLFLLTLLLCQFGCFFGQRQQWEPANYPNPTAGDWQRCNMRSRSLLCDPDGVLSESERYRVNYELGQLEASTRQVHPHKRAPFIWHIQNAIISIISPQDHGRDFCERKGITAAVALAKRVRGGNEEVFCWRDIMST
jgi:hypothetical protein